VHIGVPLTGIARMRIVCGEADWARRRSGQVMGMVKVSKGCNRYAIGDGGYIVATHCGDDRTGHSRSKAACGTLA
jgi:hypothetical protein